MTEQLTHDAAVAAAFKLTELASPTLCDEAEREFFFLGAYEVVMAAIEAYQIQSSRERQRQNPSRN
jgi:hypothetical protein